MKLLARIFVHMAWALSLLLALWALLFYFQLAREIDEEVDDSLENTSEILIRQVLGGRELPEVFPGSNNSFYLKETTGEYARSRPRMVYTDEEVLIPGKDEMEPARVLRTLFRDGQGHYRELTVLMPTIEKNDLQEAVLKWIVALYVLLLALILAVNLLLLRRTLRPLYALLRWLDEYRVGAANPPLRNDTDITEFQRLNAAALRSAARTEELFERQKTFVGNAAHEMQTPLAVCRNRLEMLAGDGGTLTAEQLEQIAALQRTLDYLVRLNRSLLLLSKIDGGQFPETEKVDLNALVRTVGSDLEEIYAARGIRYTFTEDGPFAFRMNPSLAASLVGNLLKNAFVHNTEGGEVTVRVAPERLEVCNTAVAGPLDGNRIFERFYQGARREGSTGLGLSIVDAVCRIYGLTVGYTYINSCHCFTVRPAE